MGIRNFIVHTMDGRHEAEYRRRLEHIRPSYDPWIRGKEENLPSVDLTLPEGGAADADSEYVIRVGATSFRIVPMHKCGNGFSVRAYIEDVIVFAEGELTDTAFSLIGGYFESHPNCMILTGDEDISVRERDDGLYDGIHYGNRRDPYFKPEWSPGEFASHFYFCNIVAVRRIAVRDLAFTGEVTGAASLYHNLSKLIFANDFNVHNCVGHVGEVLIHAAGYSNNDITDDFVRESAVLLNREGNNEADVSVVILTKDNVPRLSKCLGLLKTALTDAGLSHEIRVVDLASSESSRRNTVDLQLKYGFDYEYSDKVLSETEGYELGILRATGKTVLVMSDGIMFEDPRALKSMHDMAGYRFSGVTGIKLIKSGTDRLVHAGLVITRLGLMYKLKGLSDLEDRGNGYNRFDRNVSAVSFKCAMFKRKLYEKAGGFDRDIPEEFKGADLCLKLMEAGYYNAVCNSIAAFTDLFEEEYSPEVILGKDLPLSDRLRMTGAHPIMKGRDPYYSDRLERDSLDVRIVPACEFEYETAAEDTGKIGADLTLEKPEDQRLHLSIEYGGPLDVYLGGEAGDKMYIQGYMYLEGYNNACFSKSLLLIGEKISYDIPIAGCFRSDVRARDADTSNLLLSGFAVRIPKGSLEGGTYQIGAKMKGSFPKQEFVNSSDVYLVVNK